MRLICSLLNSGLNYLRSKWIKQKHERKSILYAVCVCARGSIQNVLFFAVKPLCLVKKRATLCSHYVHDCCQNKRGKRRCYTWTRTCCVYSKVNHINTRRCLRHGDECTLLSLSPLVGGTVPPPFFFHAFWIQFHGNQQHANVFCTSAEDWEGGEGHGNICVMRRRRRRRRGRRRGTARERWYCWWTSCVAFLFLLLFSVHPSSFCLLFFFSKLICLSSISGNLE